MTSRTKRDAHAARGGRSTDEARVRSPWGTRTFLAAAAAVAFLGVPAEPLAAQRADTTPPPASPQEGPQRVEVHVDGMSCPFCAYGLEKRLRKIEGLDSLRIDLEGAMAVLYLADGARVTDEALRRAVRDAGFTAGEIERGPPAGRRPQG